MHPVVFSPAWFERYQTVLIGLLRMPVIGRELRDVLAIRRHDVGYDGRIVRITPHSYTVANPDGTFTTDFRTHHKYAKRLRYQLDGLWQAAHAWDQYIANPLVPALNVGFDTLTVYPDAGDPAASAVDGPVERNGVDETWATIRAATGTGTGATTTVSPFIDIRASATANQWQLLGRSIFLFNTSALTASATISSATLSLYGEAAQTFDNLSVSPNIDIYTSAPASNTTLALGDFSTLGTTSQTGSPITYAGWNGAGYNAFAFNATGIASISKTGVSKFGAQNANYDASNVAPTWTNVARSAVSGYYADQLGSTNDPKLEVTYSKAQALITLLGTTP